MPGHQPRPARGVRVVGLVAGGLSGLGALMNILS
jgi:hypothetical protein